MIKENQFTVDALIRYLEHLKQKEYLTHRDYYNTQDRALTKILTKENVVVKESEKSSISYFKRNFETPYFLVLEPGYTDSKANMYLCLRLNMSVSKDGYFHMEPLRVSEILDDGTEPSTTRLASTEVIRKYAKDIHKLLRRGYTNLEMFKARDVDWFSIRFPAVGSGDTLPREYESMVH